MIEIQEEKFNDDVGSPPQANYNEWKKYNKRMDDFFDDVEIKAEMEAEKKIRSKNSRLLTISIIGIFLLVLLFLKVQQHSNSPDSKTDKQPSFEKATLLPKKNLENLQASQLASITTSPVTKLTKTPTKSINFASLANRISPPKNNEIGKFFKAAIAKPIINGPNRKYYIQLGAFSNKKNAEKFANKVKFKGYDSVISVRNTESTRYQIFIGNSSKRKSMETKQTSLEASGYTSSIKSYNNYYTLDMGTFRNNKNLGSLVEKLRNEGYKPKIKKISTISKTYTVRVEGLETESAAYKTRQEMADQGFKNSFIR